VPGISMPQLAVRGAGVGSVSRTIIALVACFIVWRVWVAPVSFSPGRPSISSISWCGYLHSSPPPADNPEGLLFIEGFGSNSCFGLGAKN